MRDQKIELPSLDAPREALPEHFNYEFTVERYMSHFNITPVIETTLPPGSEIEYKESLECYREHFIFSSMDEADAQYDLWEKYLNQKISMAPVKYGIELEDDPFSIVPVSGIFHVTKREIHPQTEEFLIYRKELRVYDTLQEAVTARETALNEKPQSQSAIPQPPQKEIQETAQEVIQPELPREPISIPIQEKNTPPKRKNIPTLGK